MIASSPDFSFFFMRGKVVSFWVAVGGFRQVALHFISLVLFLRSQQSGGSIKSICLGRHQHGKEKVVFLYSSGVFLLF